VIVVCVSALIGAYAWLSKSGAGVRIRAAMENAPMAGAVGINTRRVYRLTFAVGAALAALAGALMSPLVSVEPQMGVTIAIDAFLVVIVGGLRSLAGVAAGAVVLGSVQSIVQDVSDPVLAQMAILIAAIVVIRFRPRGILAS
jgi:branched-subunit amino acid ABC-type transport system permease component